MATHLFCVGDHANVRHLFWLQQLSWRAPSPYHAVRLFYLPPNTNRGGLGGQTGSAERLPQQAQEGQRLRRSGDHRRSQRVADVADLVLAQSGRNDVHAVGDRVDTSLDCGWYW